MQVQFIGVPPSQSAYIDLVCSSAEEALSILEKSEWAKLSKGSISNLRQRGTPCSLDISPYSRAGVRFTITV